MKIDKTKCPICLETAVPLSIEGRALSKCTVCEHIFVTEWEIQYSERGIEAWRHNCEYQNIHNIDDGPEWYVFCSRRIRILLDHIPRGPKPIMSFVELGCMEGQVLKRLRDIGYSVRGYELTKDVAMLRDFIRPISIEDDPEIKNESTMVVFSFHVFEHLFNPIVTIDKVFDVLVPGGTVVIEVPFIDTDYWNPDHLHFYTEASIMKLLRRFENIRIVHDEFININKVKCSQVQVSGRKPML